MSNVTDQNSTVINDIPFGYLICHIFTLLSLSVGILISSMTLCILIFYRRSYFDVATLLTCNTCVANLLLCVTIGDLILSGLYGDRYLGSVNIVTPPNRWCITRYVLMCGFIASFYHSYILQAANRVFRVIFYRHKFLQNYLLYLITISIQWFISFLIIMPVLFWNVILYLENEHYCQAPLSSNSTFYTAFTIYFIPLLIMIPMYIWIWLHIRRSTSNTLRKQQNLRDFLVLKRLIIQMSVLISVGFPIMAIWIVYLITGYLHPYTHRIQWLTVSFGLACISVMIILLTPNLKNVLCNIIKSVTRLQTNRIIPAGEIMNQTRNSATNLC
ncbi:unnamed protein product [Didymodactylos carnosus]|uniref:G-protein coupled receptors family 1 profile domain-containing protein n=1 Tax=Didymodactylos carnosus TaxID=1234261 RepID=A0A814VHM9_9BILA|nr:unnamed protein product [Didymodactylos carnosus]CAF3953382.1 unnamed protein product [Didymodactylos carnosus]